ncbi:angiopoietin-related protein 7-like [Saccostrea echinata]|uniref:angiopoietin-related protein 7-like n=1 Tax=Saccostrea echinata TaxID=191078 RepID=UPI002A800EFF|nr:angiopoietin-related protein 7-like [Saccostrea echinata]
MASICTLPQTGFVPRDCSDIHKISPNGPSGVYRIYPVGGQGYQVFCDMKLDGGGWTVFQRRKNGYVNFYRNWLEYKKGFGSVRGEHWLGNEALHEITSHGYYELRINLKDFNGNKRFAKYSQVRISNEAHGYRLTVSGYTGNAGDSLAYSQGARFSTFDRDQDYHSVNCAEINKGAWWYKGCSDSLLNSIYYRNPTGHDPWQGIIWYHWKGEKYSLKSTTMMIRKHQQTK